MFIMINPGVKSVFILFKTRPSYPRIMYVIVFLNITTTDENTYMAQTLVQTERLLGTFGTIQF